MQALVPAQVVAVLLDIGKLAEAGPGAADEGHGLQAPVVRVRGFPRVPEIDRDERRVQAQPIVQAVTVALEAHQPVDLVGRGQEPLVSRRGGGRDRHENAQSQHGGQQS